MYQIEMANRVEYVRCSKCWACWCNGCILHYIPLIHEHIHGLCEQNDLNFWILTAKQNREIVSKEENVSQQLSAVTKRKMKRQFGNKNRTDCEHRIRMLNLINWKHRSAHTGISMLSQLINHNVRKACHSDGTTTAHNHIPFWFLTPIQRWNRQSILRFSFSVHHSCHCHVELHRFQYHNVCVRVRIFCEWNVLCI